MSRSKKLNIKAVIALLSLAVVLFSSGCQNNVAVGERIETAQAEQWICEGEPDMDQLSERLTEVQFAVTQENATEPAFNNQYWDFKGEGIYVDIVSGEPLFSSTDKYDSGSGWPSFTQPIEKERVSEHEDDSYGMIRVEVRSKEADSHLGHLFSDGPAPTGQRYCINSAALRFVGKEQMADEGYEEYLYLFD